MNYLTNVDIVRKGLAAIITTDVNLVCNLRRPIILH